MRGGKISRFIWLSELLLAFLRNNIFSFSVLFLSETNYMGVSSRGDLLTHSVCSTSVSLMDVLQGLLSGCCIKHRWQSVAVRKGISWRSQSRWNQQMHWRGSDRWAWGLCWVGDGKDSGGNCWSRGNMVIWKRTEQIEKHQRQLSAEFVAKIPPNL